MWTIYSTESSQKKFLFCIFDNISSVTVKVRSESPTLSARVEKSYDVLKLLIKIEITKIIEQ